MISIMSTWPDLFERAPERDLEAGESLFRREEPVRSMFLVRGGAVALERPMADGTALTLHIAGEDTLLTEASLFAQAYHCDAVARAAARVASVSKDAFLAALRASPAAALDLFANAAREVQALACPMRWVRVQS
jgi:CRP-like cAMP-binding protein